MKKTTNYLTVTVITPQAVFNEGATKLLDPLRESHYFFFDDSDSDEVAVACWQVRSLGLRNPHSKVKVAAWRVPPALMSALGGYANTTATRIGESIGS